MKGQDDQKGSEFFKYLLSFTFLLIMINTFLYADDRSNARGLGMSTSSVVSSSGIDAFGINPANYYYPYRLNNRNSDIRQLRTSKQVKNPVYEVSILSVGGGYGSDKTLQFYSTYLKYLSIRRETFANRFLNLDSVFAFRRNVLPDENTDVSYDFELKWMSLNYINSKYGAFNVTVSDKVGLNTSVADKNSSFPMPAIVFHEGGKYDILGADLHLSEAIAWWIRKYSIGFAKEIKTKGIFKNITIGCAAGLVHGFGHVSIFRSGIKLNTYGIRADSIGNHIDSIKGKQDFYTQQSLTDLFQDYIDGAKSHFTFFPKPAGKGYSFDIGIKAQVGDNLEIGASITELGKIFWNYNTLLNNDTSSLRYTDFYVRTEDPTYNAFVNDLDGLDTRIPNVDYSTSMPTKMRAGILYKAEPNLLFELDWEKGTNNLPSNSTRNKVSLGAEYNFINNLSIRGGLSIGGLESFNIALGAGYVYKDLTIDISTYNLNKIWRQFISNNRVSISLSGKLLF